MLDHESSNPYYRQIADYFAAQIRDEVLKPGRKLPSESELCSQEKEPMCSSARWRKSPGTIPALPPS